MTIIVNINGQDVPVDDAFGKLTPEQQELEKAHIAEQISGGATFGGGVAKEAKEPTTVMGLPVALAPEAGAAIGSTLGAVISPSAAAAVDKPIAQVANRIKPTPVNQNPNAPQSVRNWLATQTSTPYAGGRDQSEAYKKAEVAGGKPIQSRGSNQGIRRGNLGINTQPPAETLPQKAAANILNAERMPKPGIPRRMIGMGVAGGEAGNMISEYDQGNYGRAMLSGVGAAGGAMSQSGIKPVRALGTALSVGVPAIQKFLLKDKDEDQSNIQEKAAGGSVESPRLKSLSDFLDQLMKQAAAAPTPAPMPQGAPQGAPQQGGIALPPELQQAALQQAQQAPSMGAQPPMGNLPSAPVQPPMPQMATGGKVGALESLAKKFHEVLTPYEGKTLLATLADRTKATEGFQGGPGFINLHPDYTWAVDAPAVGKKHMEAVERFGGPKQTVMAPMLMSREAHKSNRPVFEQIYGNVLNKVKTGELSKEQIDAINHRIAIEKKADLSKNPGIESPDFLEFANAFNRRGALADIFGLKKLGATDLQKHLDDTIDPALKEASTGSIGPQLFTMSGYENAPGIHGGYNIGFRGEKGADQFIPAEREFVFRDLEKQANEQMGRPMTDYNYRNILKEHGGIPNQFIDERLLRGLQEVGRKKGGLV
jgi:hypothetical protein